MQSKVHPTYKTKYRVANWASYDRALVRRGDVTVWAYGAETRPSVVSENSAKTSVAGSSCEKTTADG